MKATAIACLFLVLGLACLAHAELPSAELSKFMAAVGDVLKGESHTTTHTATMSGLLEELVRHNTRSSDPALNKQAFLNTLESPSVLASVTQSALRLVEANKPALESVASCAQHNATGQGCDMSSSFTSFVSTVQPQINAIVSGVQTASQGHGTRPSAPLASQKLLSGEDQQQLILGEDMAQLSKRLWFWVSILWMSLGQAFAAGSQAAQNDRTMAAQRNSKWRVIMLIAPTYEEWKRYLSSHDELKLVVPELCDLNYASDTIPLKEQGVQWDDSMVDPDQVWANPNMTVPHEIQLPKMLRNLDKYDDELRKCWNKRAKQQQSASLSDLLGRDMPRVAAAFFALWICSSLATGGRMDCPRQPLEQADGGELWCSNRNHYQSVCVKTCNKGDSQFDWDQPNDGQMTVCGTEGRWLGRLVACKASVDHRFR